MDNVQFSLDINQINRALPPVIGALKVDIHSILAFLKDVYIIA
jgi:hypothetical protein